MMSRVTDISKSKGGYKIHTDMEQTFFFPKDAWLEHDVIHENDILDQKELVNWLLPYQYKSGLAYTVSLLAQRGHSEKEIEEHLDSYGYLPEAIEMILFKLRKEELIDDSSFAVDWVQARIRSGLGKNRIRYELVRKGVSDTDILNAFDTVDQAEADASLFHVAEKAVHKYMSCDKSLRARSKVYAFLSRRGYTYDDVKNTVESIIDSEESE